MSRAPQHCGSNFFPRFSHAYNGVSRVPLRDKSLACKVNSFEKSRSFVTFAPLNSFEAGHDGAKVSAKRLCSARIIAALFLAPRFPGFKQLFDVHFEAGRHFAALPHEGPDWAA